MKSFIHLILALQKLRLKKQEKMTQLKQLKELMEQRISQALQKANFIQVLKVLTKIGNNNQIKESKSLGIAQAFCYSKEIAYGNL